MKIRRQDAFGLSSLAALFAALLLLVAWVAVAAVLDSKLSDALDAETRQNTNLAGAFSEQTLRVFAAIDQATLRTRDAVAAGASTPDLVRFANETGLTPGILVQLSLTDAAGRFIGSNLDPDGSRSGHVDLSTREHVRVHLQPAPGANRNALFIGMPVLGKVSGRWTVQVSRGIADAQGHALGVVVASLDPSYFGDVYRRVELGRTGSVTLVGADYGVRARVVGGQSAPAGGSVGSSAAFVELAPKGSGHYVAHGALDGQERLVAFRRVGDYPAFVIVSTTTHEALAGWRATRAVMVALAGVLSLVVIAAMVAFVLGVRRLERTNGALRESQARARAASDAKTQFLGAMSHELRTPLTSIRGFAELLEARLPDPRFREKASLIRKGAERLNDLLTDILDMTKLEAGALELHPGPVDVPLLVQGVGELFGVSAGHKGLELQAVVGDGVPGSVLCDGLRLRQILHHLMSNAIKFTPSGSVRLMVAGTPEELLFHVVDTGPGISPEMHETVFEMFRQGGARVSFEHGGTGLGLAFCRALAQRMGGRLELVASDAPGSHFMLALSLAAVPGGASTANQPAAAVH